jgi:hypothetical protein
MAGWVPRAGMEALDNDPSGNGTTIHHITTGMSPHPKTPFCHLMFPYITVSRIVVQFPARARDLFLVQNVQTGSGAQRASYSVANRNCFHGVKEPELEASLSPPPSMKVKNKWKYKSSPPYGFMLHGFTFLYVAK